MLYYDLINEKMASIMEKGKIWYELLKAFQDNVNAVTFTTLLRKTLNDINTSAMDVFFAKYTNKTAKD